MGFVEESQIPENRTRDRVTDERKRLGPAGEDCDSWIAKRSSNEKKKRRRKNNQQKKKGNKLVFRKSERNARVGRKKGGKRQNK